MKMKLATPCWQPFLIKPLFYLRAKKHLNLLPSIFDLFRLDLILSVPSSIYYPHNSICHYYYTTNTLIFQSSSRILQKKGAAPVTHCKAKKALVKIQIVSSWKVAIQNSSQSKILSDIFPSPIPLSGVNFLFKRSKRWENTKNAPEIVGFRGRFSGGEGEIWTLAPV